MAVAAGDSAAAGFQHNPEADIVAEVSMIDGTLSTRRSIPYRQKTSQAQHMGGRTTS